MPKKFYEILAKLSSKARRQQFEDTLLKPFQFIDFKRIKAKMDGSAFFNGAIE